MPVLLGSHGLAGHGARAAALAHRRRWQQRARGGTPRRRRLVWLHDPEQMVRQQIHEEMRWHLLARALDLDIQVIIARLQEQEGAHGWFGAIPASAAAVAGLEKRTFHATTTMEGCGGGMDECAICFEEFEDGEEVSVMPCSHRHEFHTKCITNWLGRSNTCPLCRHQLPTGDVDGQ
ncbi:unnamed protein product [Urochloa humidicola]